MIFFPFKIFLILILSLSLLLGCAVSPYKMNGAAESLFPPKGFLFTNAHYPILATENEESTKQVSVSETTIFWLFTFGDASLKSACEKASIKKIAYADLHVIDIPIFFRRQTMTVHGE